MCREEGMTSFCLQKLARAGKPQEAGNAPTASAPRAGCRGAGRVRRLQREGEAVFRPEERVPRTFNQESGELLE